MPNETLATKCDVDEIYSDLSATLNESRDAVLSHLDRGLSRMVRLLSALMVASAVPVVLAAWLAS